ncbi:MAG: hypothetical protein HY080_09980 [Gammaproteobacteria bacterium]|nr:hypothetical protein [Gammaproteobacteria bacterium]
MNESLTGTLLVFAEIGAVLAIVTIIVLIVMLRRSSKDRLAAKAFVDGLHQHELKRKENLISVMQKVHDMDPELAVKTAQSMLSCEKQIYNRVLKIFLGHDREALGQLQRDVENMAGAYRKLADTAETINGAEQVERGENPRQNAHLRTQIKQLENEKAKLERDLSEAMTSMENMLKEYTQMYSGGGKKDGVKHIENELTQLKQKISENLVEAVRQDDLPEVPDLAADLTRKTPGA